ncbi:MAG: pilus assembly protein [Gemmataceae bacterium]|nr:pilus assembly protein [Gemmataceae bacterium]
MTRRTQHRSGTTLMECAFVVPAFLVLALILLVGGLGVFRYQELASLAREGARYASVRGYKYAQTTGNNAITAQEIYDQVIRPRAVGLDLNRLTYQVTWDPDNQQGSTVTVRLTYHWVPEAFLGGMDLTGTSTMTISY